MGAYFLWMGGWIGWNFSLEAGGLGQDVLKTSVFTDQVAAKNDCFKHLLFCVYN